MSKYIVVSFVVLILLAGCTAPIVNESKTQYRDQEFSPNVIKSGGLALLPINAGPGKGSYKRPLASSIESKMDSLRFNFIFVKTRECKQMLRDSNVTEDYGELINSYLNTGMLDDSLLHTMGKTLGVRYLLFVSLEDFSESSQMGYDIFTGLHPDKEASLQAFCQVFDCASAEVVWEGVGMSKSESTSSLVNTGDIEDHVNVVAQGIINNIFQIEETDD